MNNPWQTLGTKVVYTNPWIQVREDSVINPEGKPGIYGVITPTTEAGKAVPITTEGKFVLCRQFRYCLSRHSWEFPAGQLDTDSPEEGARREMIEETGYDSEEMVALPKLSLCGGTISTYTYPFIAFNANKITSNLNGEDGISDVREFTTQEVKALIQSGELFCPHTISSFYITLDYLTEKGIAFA